MSVHSGEKTLWSVLLGVGLPAQAAAAQTLTDWRDWIKDYNLIIAGITATLIALWWMVRLCLFVRKSYLTLTAAGCGREECCRLQPPRASDED